MPINQLYDTFTHRIQELRPRQRITQIRNFVWLMTRIYHSRSVCLSRVAGKISGPAKLLSTTRRLSRLLDIPALILAAAAGAHIRKKAWFPRIPELRLEACRLAGVVIFDERQDPQLSERQLFGLEFQLRGEFRRRGELDLAVWEKLIAAYEQIGWNERAQGVRGWLEVKSKYSPQRHGEHRENLY